MWSKHCTWKQTDAMHTKLLDAATTIEDAKTLRDKNLAKRTKVCDGLAGVHSGTKECM
jgi:hypothetical protein|tara:strand:+ start:374 stop:547 length:174 start_codon:yes stop_codon:yes gene_type:complete